MLSRPCAISRRFPRAKLPSVVRQALTAASVRKCSLKIKPVRRGRDREWRPNHIQSIVNHKRWRKKLSLIAFALLPKSTDSSMRDSESSLVRQNRVNQRAANLHVCAWGDTGNQDRISQVFWISIVQSIRAALVLTELYLSSDQISF